MFFQSLTGFADENQKLVLGYTNHRDAITFSFGAQNIGYLIVRYVEHLR
jgi:hypothetical protein